MRYGTNGLPRSGFRFGGVPLIGAVVTLLALASLTYVAWPTNRNSEKNTRTSVALADPRLEVGKPLCTAKGVRCSSTSTKSGDTVEYAVVDALSNPSRGLVLIELGGPGLDLLGKASVDGFGLPADVRSFDMLLIREPWASRMPSRKCLRQLDQLGDAASSGSAGSNLFGRQGCTFNVWTRISYSDAVTAALKSQNRSLVGIIGQSYGAVLATQARVLAPNTWLLLHAPIAPPSIPATAVMAGRTKTLEQNLNASYAGICQDMRLTCRKSGIEIVREASRRSYDGPVRDRSKELKPGDIALAAMAAAYDLRGNQAWLWRTLANFPKVGGEDLNTLGRLADQLLQRFDRNSISPKLGAYIAGLCSTYQGWQKPEEIDTGGADFLLDVVATQCAGASISGGDWTTKGPTSQHAGVTCILANVSDTVVGPESAAKWASSLPGSVVRPYSYPGHSPLVRAVELVDNTCGISIRRAQK